MISLTVPNMITIMLLSILAVALAKWGLGLTGYSPSWL